MEEIVLSDKNSYNYFQSFLSSLSSLYDEKMQKRVWLNGDYSVYTSFEEVCINFSQISEDILAWDLPEDKKRLIKKTYDMVDSFLDYYDSEQKAEKDVCNDPKWDEIRCFAKKVYFDLKGVKYIPDNK